jgi:hypothetical protein
LSDLRAFSNLSAVEIFFSETKSESHVIDEACQLKTSTDFDFWWFAIEFEAVVEVKELVKSCGDQEKFFGKLATTKTESQQNILMIASSDVETFKYLLSLLVDLDHETQRRFLTELDSHGWNVLRYPFELRVDKFEFFFETYIKTLGKEEFEQTLKKCLSEFFKNLDDSNIEPIVQLITKYLDIKLIINLLEHNYYGHFIVCDYLSKRVTDESPNNDSKRFELFSLMSETCEKPKMLQTYEEIQKSPKLKSLLTYRNEMNQTIFDVVGTSKWIIAIRKVKAFVRY